jgi:hypothetical protein
MIGVLTLLQWKIGRSVDAEAGLRRIVMMVEMMGME